jgi:hypothetical protein
MPKGVMTCLVVQWNRQPRFRGSHVPMSYPNDGIISKQAISIPVYGICSTISHPCSPVFPIIRFLINLETSIQNCNRLWINHVVIPRCPVGYPQQRESNTTAIDKFFLFANMVDVMW